MRFHRGSRREQPTARSTVLPIVPMFHVNARGIPTRRRWSAPALLPGAALDGASLYELCEREKVDCSSGVPTVWFNMIAYLRQLTSGLARSDRSGARLPGRDDQDAARRVRHPRAARMGHDRDESGGHDQQSEGSARRPRSRCPDRVGDAAGPSDVRRRHQDRRRRGPRARARRRGRRGPLRARTVHPAPLFPRRGRRPARRRRVAADRRRRDDRCGRLPDHRRPLEGHDQVGRRVDQLDRAHENIAIAIPQSPRPRRSACRIRAGTSGRS